MAPKYFGWSHMQASQAIFRKNIVQPTNISYKMTSEKAQ